MFIPSAVNPRFGKGRKRRGTASSADGTQTTETKRKGGLPGILSPRGPGQPTYYPGRTKTNNDIEEPFGFKPPFASQVNN